MVGVFLSTVVPPETNFSKLLILLCMHNTGHRIILIFFATHQIFVLLDISGYLCLIIPFNLIFPLPFILFYFKLKKISLLIPSTFYFRERLLTLFTSVLFYCFIIWIPMDLFLCYVLKRFIF